MQTFHRAIVLEVLHDPVAYNRINNNNKFSLLETIFDNTGKINIADLPRNTIIVKLAKTDSNPTAYNEPIICYPFFSSHMSLPVKPSESVWVMFEESIEENYDISSFRGFWMSRICESRSVEDVNMTWSEREFSKNNLINIKNKKVRTSQKAGKTAPRKTTVGEISSGDNDTLNSGYLEDEDGTAYDNIAINSVSSQIHRKEAVPRFTKQPGDLALQGSNNTLISLGSSRYNAQEGSISSTASTLLPSNSGEIDIVVGRGQNVISNISRAATTEHGYNETDKSLENEKASEGDPDYINDRARLLVSRQRNPDELLQISFADIPDPNRPMHSANLTAQNKSLVAGVADEIRFVARENIKITIQSDNDSCGIILTSKGDVIILPGQDGVIKLGGSDADRALLCTALPVTPENGIVPEHTMLVDGSTFVGPKEVRDINREGDTFEGVKQDMGAFASRILVKGN
jgi:hypothetical protein